MSGHTFMFDHLISDFIKTSAIFDKSIFIKNLSI